MSTLVVMSRLGAMDSSLAVLAYWVSPYFADIDIADYIQIASETTSDYPRQAITFVPSRS